MFNAARTAQVRVHFDKAGSIEVKDIRLPTDKVTKKPKGFAWLELKDANSVRVSARPLALFLSPDALLRSVSVC